MNVLLLPLLPTSRSPKIVILASPKDDFFLFRTTFDVEFGELLDIILLM